MDVGTPMALYGAPLLKPECEQTIPLLEDLGRRYRRIWVTKSGTFPYPDPKVT